MVKLLTLFLCLVSVALAQNVLSDGGFEGPVYNTGLGYGNAAVPTGWTIPTSPSITYLINNYYCVSLESPTHDTPTKGLNSSSCMAAAR